MPFPYLSPAGIAGLLHANIQKICFNHFVFASVWFSRAKTPANLKSHERN